MMRSSTMVFGRHSAGLVLGALINLTLTPAQAGEVAYRDDFDAAQLAEGWTLVDEDPTNYTLSARSGFWRINTQRGTLDTGSTVHNLLFREVTGDFIIETRLEFDPHDAQQFGGLVIYESSARAVALGLAYAAGERGVFRGTVILTLGIEESGDGTRPGARYDESNTSNPNVVYLRLLRRGDQIVGGFSPDGVTYNDLAPVTAELADTVRVGVGAANGDTADCGDPCDQSIAADFDYFQISTLGVDGETPDPAVDVVLEEVVVDGPAEVAAGGTAEFAATAQYSDGTSGTVTADAEWLLAPDGLGTVEAGVVTAADVSTTQQVTVVASFVQLTSGGEVRQSGSAVLRITPPTGLPAGGAGLCGAGSATLGLAGAGLLLTGLGRRVNLGRARKC